MSFQETERDLQLLLLEHNIGRKTESRSIDCLLGGVALYTQHTGHEGGAHHTRYTMQSTWFVRSILIVGALLSGLSGQRYFG